jgi:hypothetical protein
VLRSHIPIVNFSMPSYHSKLIYARKKENFDAKTKIFVKYGSFIRKSANSDRVISILKSQLGSHQKCDLKRYEDKIIADQEKNMGSMFDDYNDLVEFCPNDNDLLTNLLYQVWLFNKSVDIEDEPLAIFMPVQCHRIASAIRIQSVYRGYMFRRRINEEKGPTFNDRIVERRAIIFIQKWWQWKKLKNRINALTKIGLYLNKINSNVLYIEENLYVSLEKITSDINSGTIFPEQTIQFDFMQGFQV